MTCSRWWIGGVFAEESTLSEKIKRVASSIAARFIACQLFGTPTSLLGAVHGLTTVGWTPCERKKHFP